MPSADAAVRSGPLRAAVSPSPFELEFTDRDGRDVLTQDPGTSTTPTGTLGFRTAAGWYHATAVVSSHGAGRRYFATLETTDPLGTRIDLAIRPSSSGVIRVGASLEGPGSDAATASGIAFKARPGERYLGFGERSDAVDQRGRTIEDYVSDGPYQANEYPVIRAFVPSPGLHARDDATYFPMPWLLSTAGYGLLVDNSETSRFRLGTDDPRAWSVEADTPRLSFRVFAGPRPADVLRRLTHVTGRQPPLDAPWVLGPWYQPTDGDFPQARELRRADVPASAANTFTHYLPCGAQQGAEAAQRERTRGFHRAGYAVTAYFNPMICTNYEPAYDAAVDAGVLTENQLGQPYNYDYTGSTVFRVGQFDFSAPGSQAFYGGLLGEAVSQGYDGWMEDFGEYTPADSRSANGMSGEQMHNLYPVLYHRASLRWQRAQARPLASYVRSGWTGVQPYAQVVWGGDPTTDWGFDGLRSAVDQALTIGTSGISRWGSDIGGFFALGSHALTEELLDRWIELGAVSGVMRTEANGFDLPPKSRPQITDRDILPLWRRYAKLRTQLYPYLRAADQTYRRTGLPLMRHLALVYPGDDRASASDQEFMFGPDLLAAPVVQPGARSRRLYVPSGRWVDVWRSLAYRERNGSLRLRRATPLRGRHNIAVAAPLDELPLLARCGTILPLLPPSVDTLAPYGRGKGLVKLSDARRRLDLIALPRGRSTARFGTHGVIRSVERPGEWRLAIDGVARARYHLQASTATLRHPFDVTRVSVDGRRLPRGRWSYARASGVLRARLPAQPSRRVELVVR